MEVRPGANPADVKNYDTDRLMFQHYYPEGL